MVIAVLKMMRFGPTLLLAALSTTQVVAQSSSSNTSSSVSADGVHSPFFFPYLSIFLTFFCVTATVLRTRTSSSGSGSIAKLNGLRHVELLLVCQAVRGASRLLRDTWDRPGRLQYIKDTVQRRNTIHCQGWGSLDLPWRVQYPGWRYDRHGSHGGR